MELLLEKLTGQIIACGIEVHRTLGPGLLEQVYHKCLEYELSNSNLEFKSELIVPLKYKKFSSEFTYRLDLLVQDLVIVEIKAVGEISNLHKSQLYTYLKLTNKKVGLLFNFNTKFFSDGVARVINVKNGAQEGIVN